MFIATIKLENDRDMEALRDLLERAADEGEIAGAFELKFDEVRETTSDRWGFDNGSE